MEFITEEIITYVYNNYDNKLLKNIEDVFFERVKKNKQQFADWLVYDYINSNKLSFGEMFLQNMKNNIKEEKREFIEEAIKGFLSIYEVTKKTKDRVLLKNLFTHVVYSVPFGHIEEDINKHDMVACRIVGEDSRFVSDNIIVLPSQFKTMLVGYVVEAYDMKKNHSMYITYEEYFKGYAIELLEIIDKLLSFQNQAADITLYQSSYAVKDYNIIKEYLKGLSSAIELDDDIEIYTLLDHQKTAIAEITLEKQRLEVACNSKEDRNRVKKLFEGQLKNRIIHLKDEELTIDDIL
ncbi:hypothetical protein F8154_01170 [Alkaliphilus pronyensis]|uniref:Uncharacterized protein n=1 Tax=Alkaliphilus pronyensis TaxID=1482732 RepID=A0A6I0FFK3_9FIRM|nr:hypothetical protein [Alkaliphilus pronyensis]KAB3539072.1 hypothetical protein F8154_01170 [Alkaliphilus pronyensis]